MFKIPDLPNKTTTRKSGNNKLASVLKSLEKPDKSQKSKRIDSRKQSATLISDDVIEINSNDSFFAEAKPIQVEPLKRSKTSYNPAPISVSSTSVKNE